MKALLHTLSALDPKPRAHKFAEMWFCEDCGDEFDIDDAGTIERVEPSEAWGQREMTHRHVLTCPCCGSEEIYEVEQ
jgi:hypothetical protein